MRRATVRGGRAQQFEADLGIVARTVPVGCGPREARVGRGLRRWRPATIRRFSHPGVGTGTAVRTPCTTTASGALTCGTSVNSLVTSENFSASKGRSSRSRPIISWVKREGSWNGYHGPDVGTHRQGARGSDLAGTVCQPRHMGTRGMSIVLPKPRRIPATDAADRGPPWPG